MIPPTFLLADASNPHRGGDDHEPDVAARGLLGWILPASIALHVALVLLLPHARTAEGRVVAPSVVEVPEPLPPVPPPQPPQPPKAPIDDVPVPPRPRDVRPVHLRQPPTPIATSHDSISNAPLDFSALTLSDEPPANNEGLALPSGAPTSRGGDVVSPTPPPSAIVPSFVPLASLKRPPRAPAGLDAELERNYPVEARRSGVSGMAVLRVKLEPDGRVGRVDVVSESYPGFGSACTRTVRSARWEPPLDRDGHPVSTEIKYVCRFEVGS